jgi:gliding motility-associated lipoprotein GldH
MKISKFISLTLIVFGIFSCNNNIAFKKVKDINNTQWHKDSIVSLNFFPNKNQAYDIFFLIRNNQNYPYSNLLLISKIEDQNILNIDTLEYEMADSKGKWLGNGIWDLKESKLIYKTNYIFNDTLAKTFKIQQANRKSGEINGDEILNGIASVGIIIEKHSK